jgi:hypothetical protein
MIADGDDLSTGEGQARIAAGVLASIKKFKHVELSLLEAEILARLIDGRRSSGELVLEIFGTARGSSGYVADYYKIRRAVKSLERRGYVSSPLLGKEKPLRLTNHGVASLVRIGPEAHPPRVFPVPDLALYASSILLALATGLVSGNPAGLAGWSWVPKLLSGLFLVSIGASLVRMVETLRRVA